MSERIGHCHCNNIQLRFESRRSLEALPLRACQCSFCRSHGAVTTSDPDGKLRIAITDNCEVQHYRFALGITDFIICKRCGVYVAALMLANNQRYAVINVNSLECRLHFTATPTPTNHDEESVADRIERRMAYWTPAELSIREQRG